VPVNRAGNLLGRRVLVAVGAVLACALLWTATAAAETFTVNTTVDEVDASVGDFICFTAANKCSLRAALEEANSSSGEFDEVGFEEEVFEGDGDSVIELGSALPTVTDPLRLASRECETEAGVTGPCVEIDGVAGAPVLSLEGVEEVEVEALALTNGEAGLVAEGAPRLRVRGSWFGVGLDGSDGGNETGLLLGPGSNGSRIGGEGPGTGNLIANSSGTGLHILGSSNARVLGNELGVEPGGSQSAPNETAIAIESTAAGADAVGNTIGTRVEPAFAASPECERGCNLVSGSDSNGIDLSGSGEGGPPIETTIVGNHFGLDRTGTGSLPNAGAGILVGTAPRTVIGGSRDGDANRITGGAAAVLAEAGAPRLIVFGNLIGSRAAASGSLAPPTDGILVDSEGLSTPAEEALILDNEVGLDGGTGISNKGLGATISGNEVLGAATGIRVPAEGFENLIDGNAIEASDNAGILIEGSFNEVVGNEVIGAGGVGIRIQGSGLFGVSGNVVGGDATGTENEIGGSAGAAIEISNPKASRNEVARNHGSGNGGLFIDLIASVPDPGDPDPGDPNGEIQPPSIVLISATGASGFAEPEATVRVFRKATPLAGEIESFLGQATADEDGNWSLGFAPPLPTGTNVAATQTSEGGTSELSIAAIPQPEDQSTQASPTGDLFLDRRPPRTRMLRQPRRVPEGGVARFSFTSNEPGSRFQCSLDRARFRACASPKRYRGLRPGKHLFRVRAIDAAGNVDPTPLRRRFEVLG
jgi:CSLREA domain-containing protein